MITEPLSGGTILPSAGMGTCYSVTEHCITFQLVEVVANVSIYLLIKRCYLRTGNLESILVLDRQFLSERISTHNTQTVGKVEMSRASEADTSTTE